MSEAEYWNQKCEEMIAQFWPDFRSVPVFLREMDENMEGAYEIDPCIHANCILLNCAIGMSEEKMLEILRHELCHHIVYEKHGFVAEEHGEEWKREMEWSSK